MKTNNQQLDTLSLQSLSMFKREDQYHSKFFDWQVAYRHLFRLTDNHTIESAAYQHFRGKARILQGLAIDISAMVGCPLGCKFCESGLIEYVRPLTVIEMLDQVVYLVEEYDKPKFPQIMCSFQGIGEPSLMPSKILEASRNFLAYDQRFDISIATVGADLKALKIWRDSGLPIRNLQISCSGTVEDQIKWLMPAAPSLDELIPEIRLCAEAPNIYQLKINYILVQDFNDSVNDIRRLISYFDKIPLTVKISALNPTVASKRHGLVPAKFERAQEICQELLSKGIGSFVHGSFNSTNVSCGQLSFIEGGAL
jgi:23S rRNA (adenine2503-C2)-methyltransferase